MLPSARFLGSQACAASSLNGTRGWSGRSQRTASVPVTPQTETRLMAQRPAQMRWPTPQCLHPLSATHTCRGRLSIGMCTSTPLDSFETHLIASYCALAGPGVLLRCTSQESLIGSPGSGSCAVGVHQKLCLFDTASTGKQPSNNTFHHDKQHTLQNTKHLHPGILAHASSSCCWAKAQ